MQAASSELYVVYPTPARPGGVKGLVSRIPGAISGLISLRGKESTAAAVQAKLITFVRIETVSKQMFLLIGEESRFEVWNLADGLSLAAVQLISFVTAASVRGLTMFGKKTELCVAVNTDEMGGSLVWTYHLGNEDDKKKRNEIGKDATRLALGGCIQGIIGGERLLLVVLAQAIHGFDPLSLSEIFTAPCFPHRPTAPPAAALGPRWLAFPTTDAITPAALGGSFGGNSESDAGRSLLGVSQGVVGGLFWVGKVSKRAAQDYLQQRAAAAAVASGSGGSPAVSGPSPLTMAEDAYAKTAGAHADAAGSVLVVDLAEGRPIAKLRAHTEVCVRIHAH